MAARHLEPRLLLGRALVDRLRARAWMVPVLTTGRTGRGDVTTLCADLSWVD